MSSESTATPAPAGRDAAPHAVARELLVGLTEVTPTLYSATVRPEWIEENPDNLRHDGETPDDPEFRALVLSMHAHGFIDPIEVFLIDAATPRLRLIAGHRRLRAFRVARDEVAAGRESVLQPTLAALIHTQIDDPLFVVLRNVQENTLRRPLRPHELLLVARQLQGEGLGQQAIAAVLGISRPNLGALLAIADDPARLAAVAAGELSLRRAAEELRAASNGARGDTAPRPPAPAAGDIATAADPAPDPPSVPAAPRTTGARGTPPAPVATTSAPPPDEEPLPQGREPVVATGVAAWGAPAPGPAPTSAPAGAGEDTLAARWSTAVLIADERLAAATAAAAAGTPWPAVTLDGGHREPAVVALAALIDRLDAIRAADPDQ